jgi:uncharacterized phage protein (TIGR01671 family)
VRQIKIEVMFEVHNSDFTKKIAKHYTSVDRLISGKDKFKYNDVDIIAKRQFTGLQDKDGVDIYEGDVVNSDCYSGGAWFGRNQTRTKYVIKYNNDTGRFCFKQTDRMGDDNSMEVIGNIHQNPELLEQVK